MRPLVFAMLIGSRPPLVVRRADPVPVVHAVARSGVDLSTRLLESIDVGSVLEHAAQVDRSDGRSRWTMERPRSTPAGETRFGLAMVVETT